MTFRTASKKQVDAFHLSPPPVEAQPRNVTISIVIPTYNRKNTLLQTLPNLFAQRFPIDQYEIVVVVDGSQDGTADAIRRLTPPCRLSVLSQPRRGPAAARNAGVRAARGDIVLFVDDDIICTPDLVQQHATAHSDNRFLLVHGKIVVAPGSPPSLIMHGTQNWYEKYYDALDSRSGLELPKDVFLISNSSLRRSIVLANGGFDESIPSKEDFEFGLRLWKIGVRFRYLPSAVAFEMFVKSSWDFALKDGYLWGRSDIFLCRKHPEFRPYCGLASLGETPLWKRVLRRLAISCPLLPAIMKVPLSFAESFGWISTIRRIGLWLLHCLHRVSFLRGAARESGSWRNLLSEFAVKLPVLMYHHVGPFRPGTYPSLTVPPSMFRHQIHWLARRGYVGIRADDWTSWIRTGRGLPERPILITFDDAYADVVEYALPVLRQYGFSATIFVVTSQIGGTNAWDEIKGIGPHRLMTREQICRWAAEEIEFGAHSRTHADLRTVSNSDLEREVVGSGEDLRGTLGRKVTSFAYPYGFYNDGVSQCVANSFDVAFTCEEGLNSARSKPFLLRRTMVLPNDSWLDWVFRVKLGWSPFQQLRAKIRLRTRIRKVLKAFVGRSEV
jgi:peptidoglycan/xylan/chitin deacetylase (PgdA/CDA1 family)/glycosyltransferase involved in cell wall biosynthesis